MPLTRTLSALGATAGSVAIVIAVATSGGQGTETVTLTGCLRVGGNPVVHILRGAAAPAAGTPSSENAPAAEDYLLVSVPANLELGPMVNHRVAITGQVSQAKDGPAPPREANAAERALRRLTVQGAKEVVASCSGTGA